jgi:tetratricopeptide (TPR) repeat protein
LQRCLRVLKSFPGEENYAAGVLIYGLGGLGKSSLAARLCDRLPEYRRLVWVGQIDELAFLRTLSDRLGDTQVNARLSELGLTLKQRLRPLFQTALANPPALFVFDDFEHSLDLSEDGNVSLKPGALAVLGDLVAGLHETGSACRVIVTTRYKFPLPGPGRLYEEGLESLREADLEKKTSQLQALSSGAKTAAPVKARALELAAGNPRLLEWLNRVLLDPVTDEEAILAALEHTEARFREDVLLEKLLEQQSETGLRLLAFLSLYDLPVPRSAVVAVADREDVKSDLSRAVNVGLVEAGRDTATAEPRYYVSGLLRAALQEELTDTERLEACRRGARCLHQLWWAEGGAISEAQALEIHRLALLAGEQNIAVEIADWVAGYWVNISRYREAERLCQDTLCLEEDYRLLNTLARAEAVLGRTSEAKQHYESALAKCPRITGETEKSAVTMYAAIQHNLANLVAQQGDIPRALGFWQDSLELYEQIGDVQGKAATLHEMAGVIAQQGDIPRALGLWQDSLELAEQIGDVRGKAATLAWMAWLAHSQGDLAKARALYLQAAQALVSVRAWLDVATVLSNLGALDEADAAAFLGQAFWLALHVQVPLENMLNRAANLLQEIGFDGEAAPLFAAATVMLVQSRGAGHPELQQLIENAIKLLAHCAQQRGGSADQFGDWLTRQHLNDPDYVLPAVRQAILELVGETGWLFDPQQFVEPS